MSVVSRPRTVPRAVISELGSSRRSASAKFIAGSMWPAECPPATTTRTGPAPRPPPRARRRDGACRLGRGAHPSWADLDLGAGRDAGVLARALVVGVVTLGTGFGTA